MPESPSTLNSQLSTPDAIRDAQFRALDPRTLSGLRRRVYYDLLERGPGTTRQLAARLSLDILSVRPRVTELYQCGLVALAPRTSQLTPHEGVYRAQPPPEPPPPSHAPSQLQLV